MDIRTGDKLLYTSDEVAEGLISGQSYYVIKDTSNTFKLAETLYETNSSTEKHINLTGIGDSSHKFALINPQINVAKNNSLQIKLEDPSLTGYELKIYKENDFINEYNSSSDNSNLMLLVLVQLVLVVHQLQLSILKMYHLNFSTL